MEFITGKRREKQTVWDSRREKRTQSGERDRQRKGQAENAREERDGRVAGRLYPEHLAQVMT